MRTDPAILARHRLRNRVETAALFTGILGWMGLVGWMVLDWAGLLLAAGVSLALLLLQPVRSTTLMKAMYGAWPLSPTQAPGLYGLVAELCARAGIRRVPALLHIPRADLVALSTVGNGDSAIALSDGLLRRLSPRELVAVLAHELAHLQHGDLKILRLADAAGRLTRALALVGLVLILVTLPVALDLGGGVPAIPVALLVLAPIFSDLMTLRLSRSREFDADAGAAGLTGDPGGLIQALEHIEAVQDGGWERLARLPRWLKWIRTHPTMAERVRRLAELVPQSPWMSVPDMLVMPGLNPPPRRWWHRGGGAW